MIKDFNLKEKFNNGLLSGLTFSQIANKLGIMDKKQKNMLRLQLEALEKQKIIVLKKEKYLLKGEKKSKQSNYLLTGIVRGNERGFGFLTVDGYSEDFFIPSRKMLDALHGDTVLAKRLSLKSDEVEIVKVIKRGITKIIGNFYNDGKVYFVRPDDKSYFYDIIIPKIGKTRVGDKVVVEIYEFPKNKNPLGKIVDNLGESLSLEAEEKSIILSNQIREEFYEKSIEEANAISQKVDDNQLIGRLNLKNELIFTIDGENARDFDDAVSLKVLDNGNYVLGVHIADVSNYVTENSSLGKDAFERGTSVYLPDKVIPMLPFALSNGICSLNEGVDRLTLSVISEIDKNGNTVWVKFYKSVINSKRRLTYTLVQKIIEGDEESIKNYADVVPTILKMNELKNILKVKREKQGEIDLSVKEADVFYKNGQISVSLHQANDATMLIEQFMIYANEKVAEFLFKEKLPAVYRVHEEPSFEKVSSFNLYLKNIGIQSTVSGKEPMEYKKLLDSLKGEKVYDAVNKMMLRSLQKAYYSKDNLGHFGLASKCYLHFTSPIRRYPDLVVHRILKMAIDGQKGQLIDLYKDIVESSAENSSIKEKSATLCQRDVDDLYKAYYMKDYVGEEFEGVISGVTNFGVFVELENTIEGLIRIENLPRRNYHFNEESMRLECGKFSLAIGEKVRIGVLFVDISSRKIEFAYLGKVKE